MERYFKVSLSLESLYLLLKFLHWYKFFIKIQAKVFLACCASNWHSVKSDIRVTYSSIVFEVIRTISGLFIYVFTRTIFTLLEAFVRTKNCYLCCLVFAQFYFVSWFFAYSQNIFVQKLNKPEIVLITSNTVWRIPLSTRLWEVIFQELSANSFLLHSFFLFVRISFYLRSSVKIFFYLSKLILIYVHLFLFVRIPFNLRLSVKIFFYLSESIFICVHLFLFVRINLFMKIRKCMNPII